MASVNNTKKLRDVMGNPMYPMIIDSDNVDVKLVLDNLKKSLNNINTSLNNINNNITNTLGDIDSFVDYLNEVVENINNRLSTIDGSNNILDNDGICRVYVGPSDLYVDHNYTGTNVDGSQSKPFSSFAQLTNYLKLYKTINAILTVHIITNGEYRESLELSGFTGGGYIVLSFNNNSYMIVTNTREFGIKLSNMNLGVTINSYRVFDTVHGILAYNCRRIVVNNSVLTCKTTGATLYKTNAFFDTTDFSNCYCAIDAHDYSTNVYCLKCGGSCTVAFKVQTGATVHYGSTAYDSTYPLGQLNQLEGRIFKHGTPSAVGSWTYTPGSKPTPSATAKFTSTFYYTGVSSYKPESGKWVGDCISGDYRDKGDSAGHIFYNMEEIRNFLNSGTVIDGATISLNRVYTTGSPGNIDMWIGGSSASNASGTPTYGNRAKVGELAWGDTKTFHLSKAIVDGIKSGVYNSLTTYGSGYGSVIYCVLVLKVQT